MPVNLRSPVITLTLKKTVGRTTINGKVPVSTRFAGQRREIDLTPFLDQLPVTVSKSVRDAAGSFSITLVDRIDAEGQDSLYGLIEPMDLVEIRMAGDAYKYSGKPPILMRGFVSEIRRSQVMQPDGRPIRRVIITGQDYGKIWQIMELFVLPNSDLGANLISQFPFFQRFGVDFNTMPADIFVQQVFDKVVNPYIDGIAGISQSTQGTSYVQRIGVDTQILDGVVSPFQYGGWNGGTVYDLLSQNCDVGAFNELFIEDRDAGPFVVFRQNPFFSAANDPLHKNSKATEVIDVSQSDVVSLEVSRSDSNVANYYWVETAAYDAFYGDLLRALAFQGDPNSFFITNYGNVDPRLYGTRKLVEVTREQFRDSVNMGNGTPSGADRTRNESNLIGFINARRQFLIDQNKDNVVFESGNMILKGNEAIRPGKYLRLKHGNMLSLYYCERVSHEFVTFERYITRVSFERGTGFIDRSRQESGISSPYLSELAGGHT